MTRLFPEQILCSLLPPGKRTDTRNGSILSSDFRIVSAFQRNPSPLFPKDTCLGAEKAVTTKAKEIYKFACNCTPSLADSVAAHALVSAAILQLNTLNETLASLQKEMDLLASSLPEYDTVMSLYGVGSVLGSQLIAEIGDVSRFSNKKALVGFAGIDAPPFQSGNFNPQSRSISKRGSAALRKTLFQIMAVILQNAPANEPVFLFMDKKRSEGKHFYVYMMAGANKFLRIYYARVMESLNSLREAA